MWLPPAAAQREPHFLKGLAASTHRNGTARPMPSAEKDTEGAGGSGELINHRGYGWSMDKGGEHFALRTQKTHRAVFALAR